MKTALVISFYFFSFAAFSQKGASITFENWLSLKQVGAPVISSNGKLIAYTVTSTDWSNNTYDTEIWLSKNGETPFQLTRTYNESSTAPGFTPDNKYVSFLANRGDKTQIYLISVEGGESFPVTRDEDGISKYEFSPSGDQIAYLKAETDSTKDKTIKERYGLFTVEGEGYKQSHLWLLNFNYDSIVLAGQLPCYPVKKDTADAIKVNCINLPTARRLTSGDFTVSKFSWNPDGHSIAFTKVPDPLISSFIHADISMVDIQTKKITSLVANPSSDVFDVWSPDGKQFLYTSNVSDSTSNFYKNSHLFSYNMETHESKELAVDFDELKNILEWNASGIFFQASEKMKSKIFTLDPMGGKPIAEDWNLDITAYASFSKNTGNIAVLARDFNSLFEIYVGGYNKPLKKITNSTAQIAQWNTPVNEPVQWKSRDGAIIEGILLKPRNYDPLKKYPLLVVIHGGPTGVDRPDPTPTYVYPIMQWCEKGALVLRINYRGSAGYGEKFRSLNVKNLGIGDMWDVISGITYLNKKGLIDTSRMGCMGWSQGGYISAYLTTHTNLFKAISVGAGISNWVTYYVSTDITPFTRQYLQSTPWINPKIYLQTSPMTTIKQAHTPTLIQHGELDKRVPISNAYELYRGLQDQGVPSRLIIYKGFGHGITKPKERLAAIWHNWMWFNHYVFGDKETGIPTE